MFDIGFSELVLFGFIALIVLGPEKLPQAARTAGHWYAKFRRTVTTLQSEIEAELDLAETRQKMQEELAKIKKAEAEMKREMAELRGSMREFESAQSQELKGHQTASISNNNDSKPPSHHSELDQPQANDRRLDTALDDHTLDYSSTSETTHSTKLTKAPSPSDSVEAPTVTRPWEHMWFRLGGYDKSRRLPNAPFLPNYRADSLLYSAQPVASPTSLAASSSVSTASTPLDGATSKDDS